MIAKLERLVAGEGSDRPLLEKIERIGDHAVDIGEQTAFLVTGEFRRPAGAFRAA